MSDIAALAYLEWRTIVNHARTLLRKPSRAAMWILWLAAFSVMTVARTIGPRRVTAPTGVREPLASAIFFLLVVFVGMVLLSAAYGRVRAFSSLADARFLTGGALRERTVVLWVQLRASAISIARFAMLMLLYVFVFRSAGPPIAMVSTIAAYMAFVPSVGIPMLKLRMRFGQALGVAIAYLCIAVGTLPLVCIGAGYLSPAFAGASRAVVMLGLGGPVTAALSGDWRPIVVVWALAGLFVALASIGARDVYPELYDASVPLFTTRTLFAAMAQRRESQVKHAQSVAKPATAVVSDRSIHGFTGAWAILWKDRVLARRSPLTRIVVPGGIVVAMLAGIGVANLPQTRSDHALAFAIGGTFCILAVMAVSTLSTVSLARELSKPLWWLSVSTLRERLYVWLVSRSWFFAAFMAVALVAYFLWLGDRRFAVPAMIFAVVMAVYINAVGLLLYTFFPAQIDQRGPGVFMRPIALYGLLMPPIASGILAAVFAHSAIASMAVALLIVCGEIALLVEWSAARLRGSGAGMAQAESA